MKASLSVDVFVALAAIGWSDGSIAEEEAEGILRAAEESGLTGDALEAVRAAVREEQSLGSISLEGLSKADRVFVYATAVWLSRLDGVVETGEREALWKLGDQLGLPDGIRTKASAAAFEVAQLPSGDRPAKYDLVALEAKIKDRLTVV